MFSANSSQVSNAANYIEDVFSTYLYTGNGSTQTITNGIDLSTKGGLVWSKSRSTADNNVLLDTVRGANSILVSNTTAAASISGTPYVTATTTGYSIGTSNSQINGSGNTYASWTFRKQPKFFDVVTFTTTGAATQTINHNLLSVPGCIVVKDIANAGTSWVVYHRAIDASAPQDYRIFLNLTNARSADNAWGNTAPTSTQFTVGGSISGTASTYVAYLFAHNAGGFGLTGTDNVITCGTYTGVGGNTSVNLGFEPQFVITKGASVSSNWTMFDNMRGVVTGGVDAYLKANLADAETNSTDYIDFNSTGFTLTANSNLTNGSGYTYIYIAIRRGPMKVPTSGTSVFTPLSRAGTSSLTTISSGSVGVVDTIMAMSRDVANGMRAWDRLRGVTNWLGTYTTQAETAATGSVVGFDSMTGVRVNDGTNEVINTNSAASPYINYMFKRAPSFFDEVCYTGTGSATTIKHNLGVAPEMIITKARNVGRDWNTYHSALGNTKAILLSTAGTPLTSINYWNNTSPTSSVFSVASETNRSGDTMVAYLFATCPGVSKVGSYTGTGTGNPQTIDCGFTAGARFVLIKKTSATGNWWVWDSARGIVASVDPYLALEQTFAENFNGTSDSVDTHSTGFIVNENAQNNVNSTGATYIFLAIA